MAAPAEGQPGAPQEAITPFPTPPSFYNLYKDGADAGPPPPACPEDKYSAFGQELALGEPFVPPLEVGRLFTAQEDGSVDCKAQLLKLNHGLLFLFIELLSVLVEQPSQYAQSLMQVLATLQNMQHLVNLLRPHQARHTLEYILQQHIQQKQEALSKLQEQAAKTQQLIAAAAAAVEGAGGDVAESAIRKPLPAAMDTT